jgi:FemAB-related protein (PEP-CTERM system-associated)
VRRDYEELPLAAAALPGLHVRLAQPSDEQRWDEFVDRCPEATFFHRFGWKRILENVIHHRTAYALAEADDKVLGVLPLAEIRSWMFGNCLVSLPFCAYGGAACMAPHARVALHRLAVELAVERKVDYLELRDLRMQEPQWPRNDSYVTFRKEMAADPEANMRAIPNKQRTMVRKGIKAGLRSELQSGTSSFFALYATNMHRHGSPPLPRRYFDALRTEFGRDCEVLTVLDAHGHAVSSVLSFYFRDEVLPYYAGEMPPARELAANDFKYWELMQRACARGCRVFDFGRSKHGTGAFDFKRHWGFEPTQLHYEYRLLKRTSVPQKNPLNPRYRALITMWRHLPIGVANAVGPHIVRNLG